MTRMVPFQSQGEWTRWDPFGADFLRGFALRPVFGLIESQPQMRVDVTEDDKAYTVKAEIPGVNKEDIRISVDGSQVSITAEVRKEKEEKEGKQVVRRERFFGSVSRNVTLGHPVSEDKAQARYDDGILVLTLPKRPGANGQRIQVA